MIIFKFFFLLLRLFTYTFFIFINYFVLIALKLFYFILFLPLSLYSILNTFLFFIFLVLKYITYSCFNYFKRFYFYLKVVHVSGPVYQLLNHLTVLGVIKEKCFRRYYFYRRLYWLSGRSFKIPFIKKNLGVTIFLYQNWLLLSYFSKSDKTAFWYFYFFLSITISFKIRCLVLYWLSFTISKSFET